MASVLFRKTKVPLKPARYVGGHDDENFCPNKEQFPQHNQIMELKAGSEKKLNPMAKQAIGH